MKQLNVILFMLFFSSTVLANDDCPADIGKYTKAGLSERKSVFKPDAKNVAIFYPPLLIEYGFEDKIKLKNNIDVIFRTGGCAHYGFQFIFQGPSIQKVKENDKLKRAQTLLNMLKLTKTDEREILIRSLKSAKDPNKLKCGDAYCHLNDKGDHRIEIGYSFPL